MVMISDKPTLKRFCRTMMKGFSNELKSLLLFDYFFVVFTTNGSEYNLNTKIFSFSLVEEINGVEVIANFNKEETEIEIFAAFRKLTTTGSTQTYPLVGIKFGLVKRETNEYVKIDHDIATEFVKGATPLLSSFVSIHLDILRGIVSFQESDEGLK